MNSHSLVKPRRNLLVRGIIILLLLIGLCVLVWMRFLQKSPQQVQTRVIGMPPVASMGQFSSVSGPVELNFPRDHGPHPDFQSEWWYYTGNLQADDGRRFGFQLTFFRRAILPRSAVARRESDWATNQVYMAHFTLTDVQGQQFHSFERFERGAAGLAGAQGDTSFKVWLRDWSVEQSGSNKYHLQARQEGTAIDLHLLDQKGPVLQGDRGYSQKGSQPGNASIYYSETRLESEGTISLAGKTYQVSGLSWLDREISTSALSQGEVGWDWFALQMDDGSELMAYMLRRSDGSIAKFSSGTYVDVNGRAHHLSRDDFQITSTSTWRSPHSGGIYPANWRVLVPSLGLDLQVKPLVADQELNVSFTYWEGAVGLQGTLGGKRVAGYGYVELTGYAKPLEGGF